MEFENELNLIGKGLTGFDINDLSDKDCAELLLVRTIENNKDEIAEDSKITLPVTEDVVRYIYKIYCSTSCRYDKVNLHTISKAINLACLYAK